MKKMSFVLSAVVMLALLLSACAGGNNTGNNTGAEGTPGIDLTAEVPGAGTDTGTDTGAIPGTGADTTGTPATGGEMGTTPTTSAGAGGEVGTTPTATTSTGGDTGTTPTATTGAGAGGGAGANATPTVSTGGGAGAGTTPTATTGAGAGSEQTSTPMAGVPGMEARYVLLSEVLRTNVTADDGTHVGSVQGLVLERGGIPVTGGAGSTTTDMGKGALATPTASGGASGAAGATSTPGAGMASSDNTEGASISYVIVDISGAGATSGATGAAGSTPTAATGSGSTDATPTAVTGGNTAGGSTAGGSTSLANQVLVPWAAFDFEGAATASTGEMTELTLSSDVDASALAAAPAFDESAAVGTGWDAEATAYWSGQGLSIPVTGEESAQTGEPVIVRGNVGSINVMDESGQTVSQVRDFVVNIETGELEYAVLSGGNTAGGQVYLVPLDHLTWNAGQGQGQGANTWGDFSLNFSTTNLTGAPSFNSVDEIDLSSSDWNMEVDTYWESVQ